MGCWRSGSDFRQISGKLENGFRNVPEGCIGLIRTGAGQVCHAECLAYGLIARAGRGPRWQPETTGPRSLTTRVLSAEKTCYPFSTSLKAHLELRLIR